MTLNATSKCTNLIELFLSTLNPDFGSSSSNDLKLMLNVKIELISTKYVNVLLIIFV